MRLGVEGGLDEAVVRDLLAGDDHGIDVRTDLALANQIGITSVPTFVLDQKFGVSGAQPVEVMLNAIRQVWDLQGTEPEPAAEAGGCGGGLLRRRLRVRRRGRGRRRGGCRGAGSRDRADLAASGRVTAGSGYEDTPRTWKSPPALAAFLPWGSSAGYHHAGCRGQS